MILSTEAVTKKFGSLTALNSISWGVETGSTKAIIGPNGAGKSTFFNVLSGVLSPTEGSVIYQGEDISGLSPAQIARRGIVKTYQITNVFEEASVFENIRIAAQVNHTTYDMLSRAADKEQINAEAERVLEQVQMTQLRETPAETLSHGDQRKLEVGIALATDPDLILFDEPTAGMSPEETEATTELIQRLASEESLTVVITEHDIDMILSIADDITVLHQGQIIKEGSPEEITGSERVQEVYLGG
jgi:branched-chain amino acid transport system ATP-binding protein